MAFKFDKIILPEPTTKTEILVISTESKSDCEQALLSLSAICLAMASQIPKIEFLKVQQLNNTLYSYLNKYKLCFILTDEDTLKEFNFTHQDALIILMPVFKSDVKYPKNNIVLLEEKFPFPIHLGEQEIISKIGGNSPFKNDFNELVIQNNNTIKVRFNILNSYFDELLNHFDGSIKANRICSINRFIRSIIEANSKTILPKLDEKPISLLTIDSEDQHNYFDNNNLKCTDILGSNHNTDDMRFSNAILESTRRLLQYGIKPNFLVTGSELRQDSLDSFGNPIDDIHQNLAALKELSKNPNVGIGTHGFDHETWLKFGKSNISRLSLWEKFKYFFECGGNIPTLYFYLLYCVKLGFKNKEGALGIRGEFNESDLKYQFEELENLFSSHEIPFTKFNRYCGYRRSHQVVHYLDKNNYYDSSDLIDTEHEAISPSPYILFCFKDGVLRLSTVKEFPCIFIDKYFRTSQKRLIREIMDYLEKALQYPETYLTIITHTKITGGDYKHCHIYARNPLAGLAQPPKKENLESILSLISNKSRSITIKELNQQMVTK